MYQIYNKDIIQIFWEFVSLKYDFFSESQKVYLENKKMQRFFLVDSILVVQILDALGLLPKEVDLYSRFFSYVQNRYCEDMTLFTTGVFPSMAKKFNAMKTKGIVKNVYMKRSINSNIKELEDTEILPKFESTDSISFRDDRIILIDGGEELARVMLKKAMLRYCKFYMLIHKNIKPDEYSQCEYRDWYFNLKRDLENNLDDEILEKKIHFGEKVYPVLYNRYLPY